MDRAEALMIRAQRRAILLAKAVWQRVVPRPPVRTYVFVAGMQRSGTNMVMDVLERSLGTDVYHENDPRAFERYEMRDPAVIRQLANGSGTPLFRAWAENWGKRLRESLAERFRGCHARG